VVSTVETSVLVVVISAVDVGSSDSRASVSSVVAGADVVLDNRGSKSTGSRGNGSDFRVTEAIVALVALPELHAGALGVAVGRAGTVALLLLVVLGHEELEGDGNQEEEASKLLVCNGECRMVQDLRSNNGNSEAGSVELADGSERSRIGDLVSLTVAAETLLGRGGSVTKRSLNVSRARRCTIACEDSNSNHATAAKEIENYSEESKDLLSAEAACQQDSEDGVEDNGARNALDGLLPAWDCDIAVSLDSEEVAVDSKNDSSAAECERVDQGRAKAQDSTANSHCEGSWVSKKK
jgi:hypothetical protein